MENLRQKIAFLYPEQAEEVYQKLRQIIDDFLDTAKGWPKRRLFLTAAVKKHPVFSEKDIVLICYPDHVSETKHHSNNDRGNNGTLGGLYKFLLKYAKGLINKVHLLPFYPYSSDDGFSIIDYCQVKKEFGDWEDVRGIGNNFGLMFDFVVNHVSSKNEWFKKFLAGDPKYKNYFIAFEKKIDTSSVYRPRAHPLLTQFKAATSPAAGFPPVSARKRTARCREPFYPRQPSSSSHTTKYVWTTFSADQIDLNYKNPEVLLEIVKVLLFYISQGASIIRLDAVRYLWKELGTSCVDLPQTHTIVKLFRQVLDKIASGIWLVSEAKGSPHTAFSYFGAGDDESHLVYNFQLPALLLSAFFKGKATELSRWAKGLKTPSSKTAFFNVTATHDGIGLTPLAGFMPKEEITQLVNYTLENKGLVNYHAVGEKLEPYELNIVYLNALGGVKPFLASQAIQLSLQGVPGIYFNSLTGAENWLEGVRKLGDNRAINREKFDYQKLALELGDKKSIKHQVYQGYKRLLQTRINEPLFSPLVGQQVVDIHPKIFAVLRFAEENKLLALTNISGQSVAIETETIMKILEKKQARDLIWGREIDLTKYNLLPLAPYQSLWCK